MTGCHPGDIALLQTYGYTFVRVQFEKPTWHAQAEIPQGFYNQAFYLSDSTLKMFSTVRGWCGFCARAIKKAGIYVVQNATKKILHHAGRKSRQ